MNSTSTPTTTKQHLSRKELSELTGIRASTIRFYSDEGLLPFGQEGEGLARRYDRDQAARRLEEIQALQVLGLNIPQIKQRLVASSA